MCFSKVYAHYDKKDSQSVTGVHVLLYFVFDDI